jgi:hypothetical protein
MHPTRGLQPGCGLGECHHRHGKVRGLVQLALRCQGVKQPVELLALVAQPRP